MEKQVLSIISRLIEKTDKNEIVWKKIGDQCYVLFLKSAWVAIEHEEGSVFDVCHLFFYDRCSKCIGRYSSDKAFFGSLRSLYEKASGSDFSNTEEYRKNMYEKILAELEDDDVVVGKK